MLLCHSNIIRLIIKSPSVTNIFDARYKYFDYLQFRRKIIKIGRYLLEIYFIYQSPFSDSSILIFIKEMPKILRGYKPEEEAKDFLE